MLAAKRGKERGVDMGTRGEGELQRRLSATFALGCGTYLAWFYVVFLQLYTPVAFKVAPLSVVQMLPGLSALAVMAACSLASDRLAPLSRHFKLTVVIGVLSFAGVAGSLAVQVAAPASVAVFAAGAVSFGIGFGWFTLLWAELLGRFDVKRGAALWGCSVLVAAVLCLLLRAMVVTVAPLVSLAFPALTAVFAVVAVSTVDRIVEEEGPFSRAERPLDRFPWASVSLVLIYAFVFGLSSAVFSSANAELVGQGMAGIALLVVFPPLFARGKARDLGKFIMPCVVVGLLLVPLADADAFAVQVLINAGFSLLVSVYILFVVGFASRLEEPSIRTVGLVYAAAFVAVSGGSLAGQVLPAVLSAAPDRVTIAVCSAIILVVVTACWPQRFDPVRLLSEPRADDDDAKGSSPGQTGEIVVTLAETIEARCDQLAEEYGLSTREREVLEHLALGKSIARTANALYLSHATIKTHVHHIYGKLGIHSRDELRDVLDIS